MMETNIRIVEPGPELELLTRSVKIKTLAPSVKMLEKVCNEFAKRGLAAVYCSQSERILVLARGSISPFEVKDEKENWVVEVEDSGGNRKLRFSRSNSDELLLARLIERQLRIEIKRHLPLRTINSPRIFYEPKPFQRAEGVEAYRRFEISAIPIEGVGVGLSVEVGVAFFTQWSVVDFFRNDLPRREKERRQKRFESLSERQSGQKGTLRYDSGKNLSSCYFDRFLPGITCATTGKRIVKEEVYDSLLKYYQRKQSHLKIDADDCVAMVSFKDISEPQPVAAKLLRLRVMNDALPKSLKHVDTIKPWERVRLINSFWQRLGNDVLGNGKPRVSRYFWQPYFKNVIDLLPPALQFADGFTLAAPRQRSSSEFRTHYKQRLPLLRKVGCLEAPISMDRTIHFAIPTKVREEMRGRLIMDVTEHLKQLTKKQINPEIVLYDTLDEVFSELNRHLKPGIIVFVFNNQSPETYYKVAFELPNWRVKRITLKELENKFGKLKPTSNHGASQLSKSERDWNSFVEMITLDVLQQMDCIPWGFKDEPPYDAHLAIDVGRNKRDFALSLLTFHPSLSIRTVIQRKIDSKHETINEVVLHEEIVKFFKKAAERRDFQMPHSLLILRDGRECGRELEGINKAKNELIEKGHLAEAAKVDVIDFHKNIKKGIRLWERAGKNWVEQILEGTAFFLDDQTVVLTTTGASTLRQGTAVPVLLMGRSENIDMNRVTKAIYASTHLNFSKPDAAQKLPLELKRTDDELESRDSQEIPRRISAGT